ncbi:VanW family protein [Clostridium paridis]|uniref:VanW family protein n=1 Tax=Clostridium paridis TaxID=2803863 RepID=A0A937FFS5_9CLOT|nr:VanW family protein [Clostridium paridis]MBL4932554.1 VanW family protein [Clostridium paridis]
MMKKDSKKNKFRINKKVVVPILVIIAVILSGTSAYALFTNSKIKSWSDQVYPGVKVQGVDLSGKTKEQVLQILKDNFVDKIKDKKINLKVNDTSFSLGYSELSTEFDVEKTANDALAVGKDSSFFGKKAWIDGKNNKNLSIDFKYDEKKLDAFKQKVTSEMNKPAKDASISISNGNISITPEQNGVKINEDELTSKLKESINGEIGKDTEIAMTTVEDKPSITKDQLSKITGKMSSYQTSYATSNPGRSTNVELATSHINGKLLMPGDTFSYNETVGERTYARGFKDAAIFVGDKVEDGLGGGICQVSTTLYRAVMAANIRSVERTNHSMPTSYSQPGLDATVVWGVLDYKFKNTYDFPVYVEAYTASRNVYVNIYGNVESMQGKTYQLVAENLETIQPTTTTVDDPTLPEGETQWDKKPVVGYKVRSYQVTYQGGKEINRETIATDTYRKVDGVLKRGTKKVEQPKAPADNKTS